RAVRTALAVVLVLAAAPDLHAQSPYEIELEVDLPVLALGMAGTMMHFVEVPPAACLPNCDPQSINPFDRSLAGNYSSTALTIADVLVFSAILLPPVVGLLDHGGHGWLEDSLVFAQTIFLTQSLVQISKLAFVRPAPLVYG